MDRGTTARMAEPGVPSDIQSLGETLAKVATGECSLAEAAGLDAAALGEALHFALIQMQVGKNDAASRVLRGLVALDAQNPIFHEYLGLALERMNDLEAALAQYSENISALEGLSAPDDRLFEAYLLRARLQARRGAVMDAKKDLERVKAHDRGLDPALTQEMLALGRAVEGGAR